MKLSEGLGMLRIALFLLQHWSMYPAALQTSVAPLSPHRKATVGTGNMGAPQKITHSTVSPRIDVWSCLASAVPDGVL